MRIFGSKDRHVSADGQSELKAQARPAESLQEPKGDAKRLTDDATLLPKLKEFYVQLASPFINKEEEAKLIALALVAKEHVMLVSEPGTAKSALAIRAGELTESKVFKKQLSKFTDPAELFGPPNAKLILEEGKFQIVTTGMLPEADIAFIDEIFRGGSAIRDTLLLIMNERVMFNGQETIPAPVRTVISATNFVSYDEEDQALYDRFMLRHFISPLAKKDWGGLVQATWNVEFNRTASVKEPVLTLADLDALYDRLSKVNKSNVKDILESIYEKAEEVLKIHITDRRKGRSLKMIAASALLEGRTKTTVEDLMVLKYIIPHDEEEAARVTAMLEDIISPVNHINRLSRINENMVSAIDQFRQDPSVVKDIAHDLEVTAKASEEAKKLIGLHSDKELRRTARAVIRSAKELSSLLSDLKAEREAKAAELTVVARNEVYG